MSRPQGCSLLLLPLPPQKTKMAKISHFSAIFPPKKCILLPWCSTKKTNKQTKILVPLLLISPVDQIISSLFQLPRWLRTLNSYLSHSIFSPPNATTVLMAPNTSSAILPDLAYASNSSLVESWANYNINNISYQPSHFKIIMIFKMLCCQSENTAGIVLAFSFLKGNSRFYMGKMGILQNSFPNTRNTWIADVANSKRHQRQDEILIIFTRTLQEISKVVCKINMSEKRASTGKLMLYEMCALQQAYAVQTGLCEVSQAYCMTEFFFENNFAEFLRYSAGKKKIKILSSPWWRF